MWQQLFLLGPGLLSLGQKKRLYQNFSVFNSLYYKALCGPSLQGKRNPCTTLPLASLIGKCHEVPFFCSQETWWQRRVPSWVLIPALESAWVGGVLACSTLLPLPHTESSQMHRAISPHRATSSGWLQVQAFITAWILLTLNRLFA